MDIELAKAKYIVWIEWGTPQNWTPIVCNSAAEVAAELLKYTGGGLSKLVTRPVDIEESIARSLNA